MPESKARKQATEKKTAGNKAKAATAAATKQKKVVAGTRDWVPYVFVPVGLLGVIWLLVYYVAGAQIGFIAALGNWNFLIGIGLIAASFLIATMWK